jgi:hypothetical protein
MAVVTTYAAEYPDPAGRPLNQMEIPSFGKGSRIHTLIGTCPIADGDSINSVVIFGKLPSNAVILPEARIGYSAVTGVSDFDLGYRARTFPTLAGDIDALIDGQSIATAGETRLIAAAAVYLIGRRLWEMLGIATDPKCELEIAGTLKAAATAAGTVTLYLPFSGV